MKITHSISQILQLNHFFIILLGGCGNGCYYDFDSLLSSFRKSEKARSRYIKPWERYFNGTCEGLIEKMRNNPDLAPWVDRYICLEGDRNVIGRLFCEELADNVFFPLKKEREEDYYNTDNWICLLTIAAVLQEYDEQHATATEPNKDDDEILLTKLSMFFKDEDIAKRFLGAARTMEDRQIIALVKHYKKYGNCTDTSKSLWNVLHEAGVYTAGYSNWSAQI